MKFFLIQSYISKSRPKIYRKFEHQPSDRRIVEGVSDGLVWFKSLHPGQMFDCDVVDLRAKANKLEVSLARFDFEFKKSWLLDSGLKDPSVKQMYELVKKLPGAQLICKAGICSFQDSKGH